MRLTAAILVLSLFCLTCCPMQAQAASINALVEQLDHPDFATREAAAQELAGHGREAIDALVAAALKGSPEVASRCVVLLERLMESKDDATIDAADAALVTLGESDQPQSAALASAALERDSLLREKRAVAKIEELGGQVQYSPDIDPLGRPIGRFPADGADGAAEEPPLRPRTILLGRNWKGGTEGLEHLRRLSHRRDLVLYVVQGSGVPLAEAQSLAGVLPGLLVHHRGPYLGVGTMTDGVAECIIGEVKENGPADKAGLRPNDAVLSLNGERIQSFHDLVDHLKEHDEGETVTITVQRRHPVSGNVQERDIKVELGTWELPRVANAPERQFQFQQRVIAPPQFPQRPAPRPTQPEPEPAEK